MASKTVGRPRLDPKEKATPERLLDAAEEVFAERGFSAARLADIARAAGIGRSSLLYHFASKEALYAASVERSVLAMTEALARALGADEAWPRGLVILAEALAELLARRPALARIVLRELIAGDGPGRRLLLAGLTPLIDAVERYIDEAVPKRGAPTRPAIMAVVASTLLQVAAGDASDALWGAAPDPGALALALFDKAAEAAAKQGAGS